jgi:peroxiredoxin
MNPASSDEIVRAAFEKARDLDGSLNERLNAMAEETRRRSPEMAAAVDRLVDRLQQSGAGEDAPKVGEIMPAFSLPDETGRIVNLKDLYRDGSAVIVFNRGHWCPYCRISINELAKVQDTISARRAQIVGIVPDRNKYASELKAESNVRFPILSDMDNGYAMSLNLAVWVGSELESIMKSIGRDLPEYQGNNSWMVPIPATFVVNQDGRVKARFIDPDYRHRVAVEDLLTALD